MSGEIQRRLQQITNDITAEKMAQVAYPVFLRGSGRFHGTPIDTGNARNHTKLKGDTISAEYPYAKRLDQGYSKQAPDGMTKPTEDYMRKWVRQQSKG